MILAQAEYDRLIRAEPQRMKNYELLSNSRSITINGDAYKYPNKLIKRSGQTITLKIPLNFEPDEHKNVGSYKAIGKVKPKYGIRIYNGYVQQKAIKDWKGYIYNGEQPLKDYYPIYQKIVEKIGYYIYKYCDIKHYYDETYINWVSYNITNMDIEHGDKITWNYANIIIQQGYITYTLEETQKQQEEYKDMVALKKVYIEKQKASNEDKERVKALFYKYNNSNKISKVNLFWTFKDTVWTDMEQQWQYIGDQDKVMQSMMPDVFQKWDVKKIEYIGAGSNYEEELSRIQEKFTVDIDDDQLKIVSKDGKKYKPLFVSTYWCVQPALIAELFNGETPHKIYKKVQSDFKDYDQISEINVWIGNKKWGSQMFETGQQLFQFMIGKYKLQSGRPQRQFLKRQGVNGKVATAYWFYGNRFSKDTPVFETEMQVRDHLRKQSYATLKIAKDGKVTVFPQYSDETVNMMQRVKVIGDIHSTADDSILKKNKQLYDLIRRKVLQDNDIKYKEKLVSFYPADVQYVTLTINISWSAIQIGRAFGIWKQNGDDTKDIQNYLENQQYNDFIDWYNVQKERNDDFYNYESQKMENVKFENKEQNQFDENVKQQDRFQKLIDQFNVLKLHSCTQTAKIDENAVKDRMDETLERIGIDAFGIGLNETMNRIAGINEESDSTSTILNMQEFKEETKDMLNKIAKMEVTRQDATEFAICFMDALTEAYELTGNYYDYLHPSLNLLVITDMISMDECMKVDGNEPDEDELQETIEKGIQIAELKGFRSKDGAAIKETFERYVDDDVVMRRLKHNADYVMGQDEDEDQE